LAAKPARYGDMNSGNERRTYSRWLCLYRREI